MKRLLSQLAKPALHATPQTAFAQTGEPFGVEGQAKPQVPQLVMLFRVLTSQPLNGLPSQLAKGAVHWRQQVLEVQVGELFGPVGQIMPQAL